MQWRNTPERYGALAQLLHWSVFLLIVLQYATGLSIEAWPRGSAERTYTFATHQAMGIVVLLAVFARLSWKMANRAPDEHGPAWQQKAARLGHALLYVLTLAVPIVGYVTVAARGRGIAFFGATLPGGFAAANRPLARTLEDVHVALAWGLATIVGVHVAAALWHHFVQRDATLRRMLPGPPHDRALADPPLQRASNSR